jgi:putative transcriptional regulator
LRRIAGCDFAELPWRNRGGGLKEVVLPDATAAARLVRVRPGERLPVACEAGSVTAVVLAGAASAGVARYERGDVIFTGPETPDAPTVAGAEECVCYVVAETPAKPAGPLSRVLHLVTGG